MIYRISFGNGSTVRIEKTAEGAAMVLARLRNMADLAQLAQALHEAAAKFEVDALCQEIEKSN